MSKHIRVKDPLEVYKSEKLQMLDDFTIFISDEIESKSTVSQGKSTLTITAMT